jgi:beta-lactamase superfamily II metal-dependent hydrolase
MAEGRVAVDLAQVFGPDKKLRTTLAWGDSVELLGETADRFKIALTDFVERPDGTQAPVQTEGFILKRQKEGPKVDKVVVPAAENRVLKVDFVDVQQGDGSLIETPDGKVILIDGGDNQLFARFLANEYRGSSLAEPQPVEAILVTHGDADHFLGLTEIFKSEQNDNARKRLFVQPKRVFHNGLVKRPGGRPEIEMLGEAQEVGGKTIITGLVDDLRDVAKTELNAPFKRWREVIDTYTSRAGSRDDLEVRRLQRGDDKAFDFLKDEEISVQVLGPIPVTKSGVKGLEYLGSPQRKFGHPSQQPQTTFSGISASHAINGHSVVLRLQYGDFRFMFAGDLNEQAETVLARDHANGKIDLQSEVFKVPHHGSADFLFEFLAAVNPVVSVVSAGDESARKEFIHPRATLMAGLGRFGRDHEPLVFVTEMVAFFEMEGYVLNNPPKDGQEWSKRRDRFFAFSRSAFGIVRVRTDGKRMLVYTNSGMAKLKESYAYTMDNGTAVPQQLRRV